MNLIPTRDRVLVELTKETMTKSGLHLPVQQQQKSRYGKVLAVGPGLYQNGTLIPNAIKVGDTVLYSNYAQIEHTLNGKPVLLMREEDILAVVTE